MLTIPAITGAEEAVMHAVLWLKLTVEVIGLGLLAAIALELQLGPGNPSTAVSPSWDQNGKLAAIAVIRTALNYFLLRELREESPGTDSNISCEKLLNGK